MKIFFILSVISIVLLHSLGYSFLSKKKENDIVTQKLQESKIIMADEDYDAALLKLKELVNEYPNNRKTEIALVTINHCYQLIGEMKEAFDYFKSIEEDNQGKPIALIAAYLYVPILIQRQLYKEALQKCDQIYKTSPGSYWAIGSLFNMANLYCENLNEVERGISIYKKIIKKYPNTQFSKIAKMEIAVRENSTY